MADKIYTRNKLRLPKYKFSNNKNRQKSKKIFTTITILIIAFTFAYFSLKAINPIMEKNCTSMAKSIATKVSNNEATKVMSKYSYDDLLIITKDEQGNVKMVGSNIITINEIISDIPVHIQEEMEKSENNQFTIPLGSFLGSNLFAGRGPKITIKMEIVGDVETNLKSEFISSGINQTLHRIYLELKCNVCILTPYKTIDEQIVNQVLLAERVIVGEIPNSYYNLEGLSTDQMVDIIQ